MATPRVMHGARAKCGIYNATTGEVKIIGTFHNVSFSTVYDTAPAYILGRFTAASLQYTSVEVVNIQCSGWRVVGHGAHVDNGLPRVQDLLDSEYIQLVVIDRQLEGQGGDPRIAKIRDVLATSSGGGYTARQLSEQTTTYVGLLVDDESTTNNEHPTAASLP